MSVSFYPAKRINHPEWGQIIAQCDEATIDFNVANTNARVLLMAIGIDSDELCGHLSINQIRQIADLIEESPVNIRQPNESRGIQGCRVIEMGLSMDQLRRYAYWLRQLANEAEQIEAEFIDYA